MMKQFEVRRYEMVGTERRHHKSDPGRNAELELMAAIVKIRKQRNITQEQLTQIANVTQTQAALTFSDSTSFAA